MSDTTELKLFRYTSPAKDDQKAKTWFLLLGLRNRTVQRVIFSKDDLNPIIVSQTYVRRSDLHGGGPLTGPFARPDLAQRIVMSRISTTLGCDVDDWMPSEDPEYDLLVFLMASRGADNAGSIQRFVGDLNLHGLLNEEFRRVLMEMLHSIYVVEEP